MSKKKKKRDKLLEVLMGFYICMESIYIGSSKQENPVIANMLVRIHLIELIAFNKEYTTKHNIARPVNKEDEYSDYILKWNEHILSKEPEMVATIEKITKKKKEDIPYIS